MRKIIVVLLSFLLLFCGCSKKLGADEIAKLLGTDKLPYDYHHASFVVDVYDLVELTSSSDYVFVGKVTGYDKTEYSNELIKTYYDHADEVNEMIQSKLKKWTSSRISRVCSAVLRLSTAEMMFSDENLDSVIINEAVELCKKFAGDNDYQFVNGVLGAISKELRA